MDTTTVLMSLALAAAALFRLGQRGGGRNILFCVAAFFVLFAYGPVINLLAGAAVYKGISLDHVDTAVTGFAAALAGMVLGDMIAPQRKVFDQAALAKGERIYVFLPLAYVGLIVYAGFIIVTRYPALVAADKLEQIEAAGPGHRIYLLLELCAVSMFFLTRQNSLLRQLWTVNLAVYLAYSLLTSERDFLFVIFSILVHREMLANRRRTIRLAGVGLGAVVVATMMFAARASERLDITGALNQGSILFVDTFLTRIVPAVLPHRLGRTYEDTLVAILPRWLVDTGRPPLSNWLVSLYAPGSRSGYGFSMTGEAYLNFGLAGVPVVFLVLTVAHRYVVNRADASQWWAYFSVYSAAVWMYALRGDSSQLLKSLFYGAMFFALFRVLSIRRLPPTVAARRPDVDVPVHDDPSKRSIERGGISCS
jgi:hypothetical protein